MSDAMSEALECPRRSLKYTVCSRRCILRASLCRVVLCSRSWEIVEQILTVCHAMKYFASKCCRYPSGQTQGRGKIHVVGLGTLRSSDYERYGALQWIVQVLCSSASCNEWLVMVALSVPKSCRTGA